MKMNGHNEHDRGDRRGIWQWEATRYGSTGDGGAEESGKGLWWERVEREKKGRQW